MVVQVCVQLVEGLQMSFYEELFEKLEIMFQRELKIIIVPPFSLCNIKPKKYIDKYFYGDLIILDNNDISNKLAKMISSKKMVYYQNFNLYRTDTFLHKLTEDIRTGKGKYSKNFPNLIPMAIVIHSLKIKNFKFYITSNTIGSKDWYFTYDPDTELYCIHYPSCLGDLTNLFERVT